MRNRILISGLVTALFCLFATGVSFSSELEEEASMSSVNRSMPVEVNYSHPDPNANWIAISALPNEADLVDTFEYQLNSDMYIQNENTKTVKPVAPAPCAIVANLNTAKCLEINGG